VDAQPLRDAGQHHSSVSVATDLVCLAHPQLTCSRPTRSGYNIIGCDDIPVLPQEARQDALLLLAKKSSYFTRAEAWPLDFYAAITQATGLNIISSARDETADGTGLPAGVMPHERMGRQEYEEFVGEMKVLLGIGNPGTSPSPYNAL
jgi:hypothetical protein